jgi:hypothetical protein
MVQEHHATIETELRPHLERKWGWGLFEGHAPGTLPASNAQNGTFTGRILFG